MQAAAVHSVVRLPLQFAFCLTTQDRQGHGSCSLRLWLRFAVAITTPQPIAAAVACTPHDRMTRLGSGHCKTILTAPLRLNPVIEKAVTNTSKSKSNPKKTRKKEEKQWEDYYCVGLLTITPQQDGRILAPLWRTRLAQALALANLPCSRLVLPAPRSSGGGPAV